MSPRHNLYNIMIINHIYSKTILTKSNLPVSDYSVNPYVGCEHACKYCYASFMKRFTNHPEEWGTFVDVKTWPEIKHPEKLSGKEIFIGSVTDPYQPAEKEFCRTRALLEQLQGSHAKISIATKSDLVIRDLDLIRTFKDARVSWSINTLDEKFRTDMDKGAGIERRLEAMKIFHDAGIRTTCFISPIFPGITDVPAIIERAVNQCNLVWLENLNLRGNFKHDILAYIHENYPELDSLYHEIYTQKDLTYWYELNDLMSGFTSEHNLEYVRNDDSMKRDFNLPPVVVNYFFHEDIIKSPHHKDKGKNKFLSTQEV